MPTVEKIVKQWLIDNKYDGLYADFACGCDLNDFMPCSDWVGGCEPGYKTKCDCGDHDFHISGESV
jgi:hypothetical protein